MLFSQVSRYGFYSTLAVVTALAFMPAQEVTITTGWDKANHGLAFAALLGLFDNAYPKLALWTKKVGVLLAYGMFIEIVQYFLHWRDFSLLDILADGVGLLLYIVVRPLIIHTMPFIKQEDFQ